MVALHRLSAALAVKVLFVIRVAGEYRASKVSGPLHALETDTNVWVIPSIPTANVMKVACPVIAPLHTPTNEGGALSAIVTVAVSVPGAPRIQFAPSVTVRVIVS